MTYEYIWIEEFKNLKQFEIPLSSVFKYSLIFNNDKQSVLSVGNIENKMPINFFSDKITNITAVVGKNGSGKTSVLNCIFGAANKLKKQLHVYYDRNENKIKYKSNFEIKIINNTSVQIEDLNPYCSFDNSVDNFQRSRSARQLIKYIKCNLEYAPLYAKINFYDKSKNLYGYVEYDEEIELFKKGDFNDLNSLAISLITEVQLFTNIRKILGIETPESFVVCFLVEKDIIQNPLKTTTNFESKEFDPFLSMCYRSKMSKLKNNREMTRDYLIQYIECLYFQSLLAITYFEGSNADYGAKDLFSNAVEISDTYENLTNYFLNTIRPIWEAEHKSAGEDINKIAYRSELLTRVVDVSVEFAKILRGIDKTRIQYNDNPKRFEIEFNKSLESHKTLYYLSFLFSAEGFDQLKSISTIDWFGMSEGEMNIMKSFSKIYSFLSRNKKNANDNEDIIILIDEPDSSLHPELARCYIQRLIEFTDEIMGELNCKVQYILSTHSPFIVSDLPSSSCLFLSDRATTYGPNAKERGTFAGNIFDLLNDNFYTDKSIGEFSYNTIKRLIEDLNKDADSVSKQNAQYLLSIIGDPIVRKVLSNRIGEVAND